MNVDFSNLQSDNKMVVNIAEDFVGFDEPPVQSGIYYIYGDTVDAN